MTYLDIAEYPLPPDLTGELARIHRLVSEGYVWWKAQRVPFDTLPRALAKLHAKYFILLDARGRKARRDAGLPAAQVVVGHRPEEGDRPKKAFVEGRVTTIYEPAETRIWPLMLLSTKKLKGEEMHHVAKKPPRWIRGGMAFQMAKDPRGKWQWEILPELYAFYEQAVAYYIARRDWEGLAHFFHSELVPLPNLKGINAQRLRLLKKAEQAWGDLYLRTAGPRRRKPAWMKELKEAWRAPLSIRRIKTQGPTLGEVLANR